MLGILTRGGRMEGADESTELRQHPNNEWFFPCQSNLLFFDLVQRKTYNWIVRNLVQSKNGAKPFLQNLNI